jgi:hypothetical protein
MGKNRPPANGTGKKRGGVGGGTPSLDADNGREEIVEWHGWYPSLEMWSSQNGHLDEVGPAVHGRLSLHRKG